MYTIAWSLGITDSAWIRTVALIAAILFFVSWVFPVGAGLANDTSAFPKWWGAAGALAFVLAIVAFGIQTHAREKVDRQTEDTTYRVYRTTTHALLLVGGLVMLAGDRITWVNCATGFLWRTWLGLYILPWWLVAMRSREIGES